MTQTPPKFSLGQVVATPGALEAVPQDRLMECLHRHAAGEWGNTTGDDARANDEAVKTGDRILSAWAIDPARPAMGRKANFWIITEAMDDDGVRAATTVLLPDEY